MYVHVLDWPDEVLALPRITGVRSAALFAGGKRVPVSAVPGATLLHLPQGRDPVDTIVVLETR